MVRCLRRAIVVVLSLFVIGVFWFALFGHDVVVRQTWTNDPGIPAGTAWIRSDSGLDGGAVTAVSAVPGTSTVYAATKEDVLYMSTDGAHQWNRAGNSSSGRFVVGVAVAPGSGGATIGKAVYKEGYFLSEDDGRTWQRSSGALRGRALSCLAAAGGPASLLAAGTTDAGLFVSMNGGRSWSSSGQTVLGSRIACVAISRDGSVIYAGTQGGKLYRSRDKGGTWSSVLLPFTAQTVVTGVDIDPGQSDHVVIVATGNGAAVSGDAGATWTRSASGALPSDCTAVCFAADGQGLVVGTRSGTIWHSFEGKEWSAVCRLVDDGQVYQLSRAGKGFASATTRGVLISPDGISWQESNAGIRNLAIQGIAASPRELGRMFGATDDGVYSSEDSGATWTRSSPSQATTCVAVLEDGVTVLAGTTRGTVLRSTDTGAHWQTVRSGIPGMRIGAVTAVAGREGTVCMITDNGFAISRDSGATWVAHNTGLAPLNRDDTEVPRVEVAAILTERGEPSVFLLGLTGQGLFVSHDEGGRWTAVTPGPATPWVSCLAQDAGSGRIYAGTAADGVLVSGDGVMWSPSGKGLSTLFSVPGTVNALAVAGDGVVYAATTSRGVAISRNAGQSWQRINHGLSDLNVRHIAVTGSGVYAVTAHNVLRLAAEAGQ